MNLVVDGVIFELNPIGGVARMFNNILPMMCDIDPTLRIQLLFTKTPNFRYPEHKQIFTFFPDRAYNLMRPWKLWKPYRKVAINALQRMWVGKTAHKIWFSTYFSRPSSGWKGSEVVMVHDLIYELFPELMPYSDLIISQKKESINSADKVFCNSNTTKRDVQKFYPRLPEDIVTIHLAKDDIFKKRTRTEMNNPVQSRFILFVGARNYYKGFDHLLDAYSNWIGREQVNLIVVGRAWTTEELQTITAKGLGTKIRLMENVDDDVLCDLYNQAEGFIYPSIYEGFGIPLLEAMACGCPIVASKIPSTLEVACDLPIYFDPGDVSGLVYALDQLLLGEGVEEKVAEGLVHAEKFSWQKTARAFYEGLRSLQNETM